MDFSSIIEQVRPSIAFIVLVKDKDIVSQGSGFVYGRGNIIITCNHVIDKECDQLLVCFSEKEMFPAKVVSRDSSHDLAMLTFEGESGPPLPIASTIGIKEGIGVLISGYPLNSGHLTTHHGILSSILKDAAGVQTYLIDGSVNQGNSGCPLLNEMGEVIGIVNATRREQSILLDKVKDMKTGALSLYGVDLVNIYHALIQNLQLGIGYAVPCSYLPVQGIEIMKHSSK